MLHYLLYKALLDERTHDLVAVAQRRQLVTAAIHDSRDAKGSAGRLKAVTARMVALFNGRHGARARSTVTHAGSVSSTMASSGAGPMGCSA